MTSPQIIFGCALIGMHGFGDEAAFGDVLATLHQGEVKQLDTAARYPPPKQGESERILGRSHSGDQGFLIDTKVLMGFDEGELTSKAIDQSIQDSLSRLQINQVECLIA
jgi:aryl-alcohol dehydrogenase-like predicted oxidoreductase